MRVNGRNYDMDAAVIACRPITFDDLGPIRHEIMMKAMAETGLDLIIYPGSVEGVCGECGVAIYVGPRQQDAIRDLDATDEEYAVECLACATLTGLDPLVQSTVVSLGNPDDPGIRS